MDRRRHALEYAQNLGANFPFLRPAGEQAERFADRVASELLGLDGDVPDHLVDEGVRLVGAAERQRLVAAYSERFPDVWEALCHDVGRQTAERELVASAVRAAVNERREPARFLVEVLEDPRVPSLPYHVLGCVLFHDDVWSLDDALAAAAAASGAEGAPAMWEAAIGSVVRARLEPAHLQRIRTQAARLERHLPFDGLPRASTLLSRACELVAHADDVAQDVAVTLLRNYVAHLVGHPGVGQRN